MFELIGSGNDDGGTIVARGATRADAVGAALTGLLAAAGCTAPAGDATLALPIRAERPDLAALVGALTSHLAEEAADNAAPIAAVRLDGLLRTDDGLTAWGYAFATPDGAPAPALPRVVDVAVVEEGAQTTITLTLAPSVDPAR